MSAAAPSAAPKIPSYKTFDQLIGQTPLVDLSALLDPEAQEKGVKVLAKAEFLNPGYSIKDRIIQHFFTEAEAKGELRSGMTVVAASSGNTGAATAMMCAMKGYKCIITTNAKCSTEKMDSIKAYGAELIVGPSSATPDSPEHYMNIPAELIKKEPLMYFDVNQYENHKNSEAYFNTLAPEIWDQTCGTLTHFVAAGSTGGTVTGVGRYLKSQNPAIRIIMPDPAGSIFKEAYENNGTHGKAKKFLVEGVGKDSIPGVLDFKLVDEMFEVNDKEAISMCHRLARTQGIFAGGSAGLNVFAAVKVANSLPGAGTVVTVLCDSGIKYLSKVYNPQYLSDNGIDLDTSYASSDSEAAVSKSSDEDTPP